jgi:hypothetical protein
MQKSETQRVRPTHQEFGRSIGLPRLQSTLGEINAGDAGPWVISIRPAALEHHLSREGGVTGLTRRGGGLAP